MSKLAWIGFFAMLTAAPASAQTAIPDLRGTWKGESESIILGAGNPHHAAAPSDQPRLNSVAFTATIDKQDGRRFSGTFSSPRGDGRDPEEPGQEPSLNIPLQEAGEIIEHVGRKRKCKPVNVRLAFSCCQDS